MIGCHKYTIYIYPFHENDIQLRQYIIIAKLIDCMKNYGL